MPGLIRSSRSASTSSREEGSGTTTPASSYDGSYPAASFPNYSEKPLSEQLEPIAVVGMGCRLPGDVKSADAFWDMMINKRTGNTPKVPASRFNIDAHYHKNNDRPGSFGVLGGYFLNDDLSDFDPGLFGITPIEAMWMDPQQRKLLEVVYEALESGGISLEAISGSRTAVFAASFTADWQQMAFKEPSFRHSLAATGVDPGIISNRISHVFNLNGPSIVVNTACSSSVYALHNACNALRNGECEAAIVGGVNLIITVDQHMNTAKLGVLSPTSTCHTFDESADGYGRADAVGAVYLKRLSDAVRDGDPVRGVIRSSAVNSNGKVPAVGITHPNREGQADVISHAYRRGGDLDPRLTGYFECHGTGTAVGDPLEVHAVSMAMNKKRAPGDDALWIGAVKTNIGHSEAASGLSALIKAVLMVERGVIAPTRGLVRPSPSIKWKEWQVRVPTEPVPFPHHLPVRRVSINSFGYGGTNAHIIVEGAASLVPHEQSYVYLDGTVTAHALKKRHAPRRAVRRKQPFLLLFSAHDKATLQRNIQAHAAVADKYDLLDLSYTLANRRSLLQSRAFTVASSRTLRETFGDVQSSFNFGEKRAKNPTLAFVFTGQGAQWPRMGAELLQYSAHFLRTIRALDAALEELSDGPEWSIEDVLQEDASSSPVNNAEYSQPLCTAVQIGLVDLLDHWGIRPAVTVGHSSGEMAAAYAAGLMSGKDAITAAYYRGQVTRDVEAEGAMLAVGLGADKIDQYLNDVRGKVVVACHNSPAGVTLSGDAEAIEHVKAKLDADSVFARAVKTNGKAYHSHHMAAVAGKYESLVRAGKDEQAHDHLAAPISTTAKMVSSVSNAIMAESTPLDETYFSRNLRQPVLFNQAVQTILTTEGLSDVNLFVEIGPHSAMSGPIKQIKAELKAEKLGYVPTLLRGTDSAVALLKVAGELFLRGFPVDMARVTAAYARAPDQKNASTSAGRLIVDLPPYQWNYTRPYWAENRTSREQRQPKFPRHDLLGQLAIGTSMAEPTWRNVLRLRDLPWLKDHSLGGEPVFPAAGYFNMAMEAITQVNELSEDPVAIESYVLRDISIKKALVTPDSDDGIEVMLNLRPSLLGQDWWDFSVSSVDAEQVRKEHMAGSIGINTSPRGKKAPRPVPAYSQRATGRAWNQALREVGFDYGPTFQDMDDIRFDGKRFEASCRTAIKQTVDETLGESRYALHPASVDSVLQLSIAAIHAGRTNAMSYGVVPIQVDEVTIWPPTREQVEARDAAAYAWVPRRGFRSFEGSAQMRACDGEMVLEIINVRTTSYEAAVPQKLENAFLGTAGPYGEMIWDLDIDCLSKTFPADGLNAADLVNLALFKKPGLKVLDVGASVAAEVLTKNAQVSYTVTVGPAVEESDTIKSIVSAYPNAKTMDLDPSEGLEAQGFAPATFDLLVAPVQPFSDALELLVEARKLLKAGGYIVSTSSAIMSFGNAHPSDIDWFFKSGTGATIGRAVSSQKAMVTNERKAQLVYRNSQSLIIASVKTALEALGWRVDVKSLKDFTSENAVAEHVIILADFEGPLLFTITEPEFLAMQTITQSTSSILWVTSGGIIQGKRPEFTMVQGLARSINSEQASLDFRTIDVDSDNTTSVQVVQSIVLVAQQQAQLSDQEPQEREFCLSSGKMHISRLTRNHALNGIFTASRNAEPTAFAHSSRLAGKVVGQGRVIFEQLSDDGSSTLGAGNVEVQIKASGLTKEGVLVMTGSDYPTTFSYEVGGIVNKVGPGVLNLRPGDRVVGFHQDAFSSYQEIPAKMLVKLDPRYDMDSMVGMLTAYANALYGLETLARIKPKDIVLILHGTGTSGAAAVKVAQLKGAVPYVQAYDDSEVLFLENHLGLDGKQIVLATDGAVSTQLEALTDGHGADVVFSAGVSVSPSLAREAWRCIARFGRFVDCGRKNVLSRSALDVVPVARSASYLPFDILDLYETRSETLSRMLWTILDLFIEGRITVPGVLRPTLLGDLDEVVSNFSESFGSPKPIIQYEESQKPVMTLPPGRAQSRFSADHTYLLVGCLGGLGRSLTAWMMDAGARRFTFLSRSGTDLPSAAKLVSEIEAEGAIVQVVRGDVTSQADVVRCVESIPTEHPLKGVVHAAMVLKDGMFHSMTFDNWKTAVAPKVAGAMNLHSVLAGLPLDFFLMTSSVSGTLGTPGQSNYAAANSYLDALARHRVSSGAAATSVILPMVLGVGVVAENTGIEDALRRKGMYGIDEVGLLEGFEAGIIARDNIQSTPDHIAIGLDPAMLQKAMADSSSADPFWTSDARFSLLVHAMKASGSADVGGNQSIMAAIRSAKSLTDALNAVVVHFIEKLARMLMLAEEDFEPHNSSIASYGLDSMIGAELRNWIFKEYRIDIPFQQLLAPTLTISKFAAQVCASAGLEI